MKTVHDILQRKGYDVVSVVPNETIYQALELMAQRNVGAVLVVESERLQGIFSERDYARKVVLEGRSSRETRVHEAMTRRVACVTKDQTIAECMALMTDKRIRHLPVVSGERIVGVVSIGDVVQATISEQKHIIEQLENYITGQR